MPDYIHSWAIVSIAVLSTTRSPESLADAIGIEPDESWRKGDRRGSRPNAAVNRFSGVSYYARLPHEDGVQIQVEDLLLRLKDSWDRLGRLAAAIASEEGTPTLRLRITRQVGEVQTGFGLSTSQLARLAAVGADVCIDIEVLNASDQRHLESARAT